MAPHAVILDLDGTVWDSLPWYAQVAGRGDPVQFSRAMEDLASGKPAARVLQDAGYTKASFRAACRSGEPQLACFPGVIEALSQLRAHGLKLAAATNLPSWMADPMATAAEIMPLLGALVDFGATNRNKPDPEPLIEALRRLDVRQAAEAWYVGDRDQDAVAASAGGLWFAWAAWGTVASVAPEGTDLILHQPADLAKLTEMPHALRPAHSRTGNHT